MVNRNNKKKDEKKFDRSAISIEPEIRSNANISQPIHSNKNE